MERRDHTVTSAGLRLHVTQWGAPTGRPVVMLHGIRGYAETFAGIAAALQPDCRVIAFDQRGRGTSDWDPQHGYYTDAYVDDLSAVVNALGLDRFDLLGHSMGGINAIVYAARFPERVNRLLVEDAGPGAFEASPGAIRIRRELATTPSHFANWDDARAFMRALRPSVTEEAREQRLQSMLRPADGGGFTWQYDHVGIAATRLNPDPARVVDLRPPVAALACDTLVVRGGKSDYLQPEMVDDMQRLNPRIRSAVVPDAGHYIHDDQPALFNQLVRDFLLPKAGDTTPQTH
ncbi:pimeloyl-ACP methyl ester carboxylesterase [Hydrogenophaga palleronii]|uniref:Pimeloyl-ACP methyl ester carboxylesterase n=1 Tax=Hydrogenophaga palleronii TaxID=65655 RepID=A0ABU1WSM4_9BURK|nr:alpha/beta hydrolase [Hydrogenophaga palleronii]MDR7151907.1 pimeloyl-ACP methyl ester carboxylesterase [Hydrogenophaga palleronii]